MVKPKASAHSLPPSGPSSAGGVVPPWRTGRDERVFLLIQSGRSLETPRLAQCQGRSRAAEAFGGPETLVFQELVHSELEEHALRLES